jgi:hypothetical protein
MELDVRHKVTATGHGLQPQRRIKIIGGAGMLSTMRRAAAF